MKSFPLFVKTTGESIVIAGGGEASAQKARLLTRTEADLVIMSPTLNAELSSLVSEGRARHVPLVVDEDTLKARLIIIATGCTAADAAIADLARQHGALVNVVDRPALCDVTMPAIVDRDPVVIAIGTEGTAPVLARQIKSVNETLLEPSLGELATFAGALRSRVSNAIPQQRRRLFWEWFVSQIRTRFASEDKEAAKALVNQVLESGAIPKSEQRSVATVDVDCAEADLLTLRALSRLQSADLILYGDAVSTDVLDLARRDAKRIKITQQSKFHDLSDKIASAGKVVILKDGQAPIAAVLTRLERQGTIIEALQSAQGRTPDHRFRLAG